MDKTLQIITLIGSVSFMLYILDMIINSKMELKYALTWIGMSCIFVLLSIFPKVLDKISGILHILSPVNSLFLIIIFLLLTMIFTLTVALTKVKKQITSISQEVGMLKSKLEKWKGKK